MSSLIVPQIRTSPRRPKVFGSGCTAILYRLRAETPTRRSPAGDPAVGFADCSGTNELIRDGINGLLVGGSDRSQALADGLTKLMSSPSLLQEFADRAPGTVAEYATEGIVTRWEELLQSVGPAGHARK